MSAHDSLDQFLADCVADCTSGAPARPPLARKLGTIDALHYHLLEGGIEFEDADGVFVHVMLSEDKVRYLVQHLSERMWACGYLLKKPA